MNKQEKNFLKWFEARKKGIGGSDAAAVLGISPWKSAYTLFCEKTGRIAEEDLSGNEYIYWGKALESAILSRFLEENPKELIAQWNTDFTIETHKVYPWMMCTLDSYLKNSFVELKTASYKDPDEWISDEGFPKQYYAQIQHCIEVLDYGYGYVACFFPDKMQFRWKKIERDSAFINEMKQKEQIFWERVQQDDWPDIDTSESTQDTLKKLFPDADETKEIHLDHHSAEDWDSIQSNREAIKFAEKKIKECSAEIKTILKDAAYGIFPDGRKISYKTTKVGPKEVKGYSFRSLKEVKNV